MIDRPSYLEKLWKWKDRDVIKVVTGVRRCGKSTLLALFAERLRACGVPAERIVSINFERLENECLLDYRVLHEEILSRASTPSASAGADAPAGPTTYVLLDEMQNVPEFQRALDSLCVRPNIDLYVTGSNALLLGGTLATLLSGRYVEVRMSPLSFAEYRAARAGEAASARRLYGRFIRDGAFPATLVFAQDEDSLHDYLEGILSTVLFKDVAQRLNVSNTLALDALTRFMFDNIGNLTSAKRISDTLAAEGVRISPNTVSEYLSGLTNSYVLYPAKRYDVRGRRLLKLQEKYYAVDMGMRRMLLSNQLRDQGRILENVVFLELMRRNAQVFVGRVGELEVDFVVEGSRGRSYYQVSESVSDERTLARELASLRAIADNHPKTLLTLDDVDPVSHDGIMQVNVLDWLLDTHEAMGGD